MTAAVLSNESKEVAETFSLDCAVGPNMLGFSPSTTPARLRHRDGNNPTATGTSPSSTPSKIRGAAWKLALNHLLNVGGKDPTSEIDVTMNANADNPNVANAALLSMGIVIGSSGNGLMSDGSRGAPEAAIPGVDALWQSLEALLNDEPPSFIVQDAIGAAGMLSRLLHYRLAAHMAPCMLLTWT